MELDLNLDDDVIGLKLINQLELIGKFVNETDEHYEMKDCMYWDLAQVAEGKYDVQFAPLTMGARTDENTTHMGVTVKINKATVFFSYHLRKEIVDRYKKLVSPIILN